MNIWTPADGDSDVIRPMAGPEPSGEGSGSDGGHTAVGAAEGDPRYDPVWAALDSMTVADLITFLHRFRKRYGVG